MKTTSKFNERFGNRHPSTQNILKWLEPSPAVKVEGGIANGVAQAIWDVATEFTESAEDSPELTAGLRKLLEAKDCLVRAALDDKPRFWTGR